MKYWLVTSLLVILFTFVIGSVVKSIPSLILGSLGISHAASMIIGIFGMPIGLYVSYLLVLKIKPSSENDLIAHRSIKQFIIIIGIASVISETWFMGSNFGFSFIPTSYMQAITFGVVSIPSFSWLIGLLVARFIVRKEKLVDPAGTRTNYWVMRAYQTALFLAIAWPALSLVTVTFGLLFPFSVGFVGAAIVPIAVVAFIIIFQIKKIRRENEN